MLIWVGAGLALGSLMGVAAAARPRFEFEEDQVSSEPTAESPIPVPDHLEGFFIPVTLGVLGDFEPHHETYLPNELPASGGFFLFEPLEELAEAVPPFVLLHSCYACEFKPGLWQVNPEGQLELSCMRHHRLNSFPLRELAEDLRSSLPLDVLASYPGTPFRNLHLNQKLIPQLEAYLPRSNP